MTQDTPLAPEAPVRVVHSTALERYEAFVGDESVGYLDYVAEGDRVVISHTVIADRYTHHGYAAQLVRHVLDDVAAGGKTVLPMCTYVQRFIDLNPSYASIAVPLTH